jgi:hypothetical protein
MGSIWQRTRLAGVAGAALAVLATGVVAGAAGGAIIMGAANSAGTTNTSLATTSTGTAFLVTQNGSGTSFRASALGAGAIAGFYTSTSGPGVSGVTAGATQYGVYAANDAGTTNGGAALRASGQHNSGIVATSSQQNAIVGVASGCTGFLCGRFGVSGTGVGFGAGVFGDGSSALFGVEGVNGLLAGVYGAGTSSSAGVYGVSDYHGVVGASGGGLTLDADCPAGNGGFFGCAGGAFSGSQNGVLGESSNGFTATAGEDTTCDFSTSPPTGCVGNALRARGNAFIDGTLTVTGAKSGYVADYAINGSKVTLHQGDAVTLLGVKPAEIGNIPMLLVGPAKAGDTVIGVVDREMKPKPNTVTIPAHTVTITGPNGEKQVTKIPAKTVPAEGGGAGFLDGGTSVAAGQHLLVVTLGAYAYGSADASAGAIKAGDELMAGTTAGKLVKSSKVTVSGKTFSVPGTSVGYALGALLDGTGRIGIFVSPH